MIIIKTKHLMINGSRTKAKKKKYYGESFPLAYFEK